MTADGKHDTVNRKGASISSMVDMDRIDRLRAEVVSIMVGGHTLLEGDPRLTVISEQLKQDRLQHGLSANPIMVGVVTKPVGRVYNPSNLIGFARFNQDAMVVHLRRTIGEDILVDGI